MKNENIKFSLKNQQLHIDNILSDSQKNDKNFYQIPLNVASIEGLTSNYIRINIVTLFTTLEKIPVIFFVLSWTSYFFETYTPEWDYDGWFIRYNYLTEKETKNFIVCDNNNNFNFTNAKHFWGPSLLRMTNLHSLPNMILRGGILPIFFGRIVLLSIFLKKWRYLKNQNFGIIDVFMYILTIFEVFSLNIFFIGNHPIDDERIHKLIGIIFVFVTILNMLGTALITFQLETKSNSHNSLLLFCSTIIFASTVILTLNSYFDFVDNRKCTPLVENHLFVFEAAAFISYIFFYWKAKTNTKNIEFLLYSSLAEMNPEIIENNCNYKPKFVENYCIKKCNKY